MRKARTTVAEEPTRVYQPSAARVARPHESLQCWKEAVELVVILYRETKAFPPAERYGITAQMRRAAVSIPSNIAEGVARHGTAERKQFLFVARGSLSELETQIIIADKLGFLNPSAASSLLEAAGKVGAMLNGLLRR